MADFQSPKLTVDGMLIEAGSVLLVRRRNPPFDGFWSLPGGFVDSGETVEAACAREVLEETGLEVKVKKLVGVYSKPGRDPRGHTVSIAYLVERVGGEISAGDDAKEAEFFPLSKLPKLAFDHKEIIGDVKKILRS